MIFFMIVSDLMMLVVCALRKSGWGRFRPLVSSLQHQRPNSKQSHNGLRDWPHVGSSWGDCMAKDGTIQHGAFLLSASVTTIRMILRRHGYGTGESRRNRAKAEQQHGGG